ncbi:MAG: 2-aminoethylphosphonate--pyruvate transaminase [Kiloniellales bacterium]
MSKDLTLLTPGPLTTSAATKQAMLHDWGSRDTSFIETNARVREQLLAIANAGDDHVCVPLQGSGTFVVEAVLGTVIPRRSKSLVLINGAYGKRMVRMLEIMGRAFATIETPEDTPPSPEALDAALAEDVDVTHVLAVHCETTSGILNPIEEIADVTASCGRSLIIDAMSAFGAIPIDAGRVTFDALMASANKCLEGVPGLGFAIIRRQALEAAEGNAHSLSLDLFDQWRAMEGNGQWRFTPPTHLIFALAAALEQFNAEGGAEGRGRRYAENCRILTSGMRGMGFSTLLFDNLQAPIIVTFHMPADPRFRFQDFYDSLRAKGFVIYPGKLTVAETFRIGCIGHIGPDEIRAALDAVRQTIAEMGVETGAPAAA